MSILKIIKDKWLHYFFEATLIASIMGIWPRYIEPKLLKLTKLSIKCGVDKSIKILQINDLHLNKRVSDRFLNKLKRKVEKERPDLIVWVGDFICNGEIDDENRLFSFLSSMKAPLGSFAVLGNHDYENAFVINHNGDYDALIKSDISPYVKGIKRLFTTSRLSGKVTPQAQSTRPHPTLLKILEKSGITLLENKTIVVGGINITGVGEYMGGQVDIKQAFKEYQKDLPGIALAHNPDAIPSLLSAPSKLILSGHTHGGQINLPILWKKFTVMEHQEYKSGIFKRNDKTIYVCRGVGGVMPFRLNASPEIVSITLRGDSWKAHSFFLQGAQGLGWKERFQSNFYP